MRQVCTGIFANVLLGNHPTDLHGHLLLDALDNLTSDGDRHSADVLFGDHAADLHRHFADDLLVDVAANLHRHLAGDDAGHHLSDGDLAGNEVRLPNTSDRDLAGPHDGRPHKAGALPRRGAGRWVHHRASPHPAKTIVVSARRLLDALIDEPAHVHRFGAEGGHRLVDGVRLYPLLRFPNRAADGVRSSRSLVSQTGRWTE